MLLYPKPPSNLLWKFENKFEYDGQHVFRVSNLDMAYAEIAQTSTLSRLRKWRECLNANWLFLLRGCNCAIQFNLTTRRTCNVTLNAT